jgi:hypothetical protein
MTGVMMRRYQETFATRNTRLVKVGFGEGRQRCDIG